MNNASKETNRYAPFKAVAIDLDGTLLSHDLTISEANLKAIEDLHANGLEIILASGRHHFSMLPIARSLPQVKWMVSAQGSFASDLDRTKVLYDSHLNPEKAAEVIDIGKEHSYSIIVYAKDGIYCLDRSEWIGYYKELAGIDPILTDKDSVLKQSIFKVVLLGSESRIDEALEIPGVKNWDLYRVRSLKNIVEFAGLGTSKAHGLKPLLSHLKIKPAELAVFGDAPNDVPMFEIAGYSVAMFGAWDEAQKTATITDTIGPAEVSFSNGVQLLLQHAQSLHA